MVGQEFQPTIRLFEVIVCTVDKMESHQRRKIASSWISLDVEFLESLYSVIGDFFMILRLFKDMVSNKEEGKNGKDIQCDLIK